MNDIQTILKTFSESYPSTQNWNNKTYRSTTNSTKIYIPVSVTTFKIGDFYNINRIPNGFIVKRSGIDSKKHIKFSRNRTIILDGSLNYEEFEGEYEFEILDEDTFKFTKI